MKAAIAVAAEDASLAEGNRLNVTGIFDSIAADSFPAQYPQMVVALRVRAEWEDRERDHDIQIQLEDEDGHKSFDLKGSIRVDDVEPGEYRNMDQIVAVRNTTFHRPGIYVFRVFIDGIEAGQQPIRLVQATPADV